MSQHLFSHVELAPRDPILGLNEAYNADTRATKVNLGVGVYYDANGKLPLLKAVREAEATRIQGAPARGYLPIEGIAAYDQAVQNLLFGAESSLISAGRVATFQAIGGTGGLKIGADFLQRLNPQAKVLISDPSWENHRALFENAGFTVETYPYYDAQTRGVNFAGMLQALEQAAAGTIVVLHACCHNPTGADLSAEEWQRIIAVAQARELVPFLDMAYQGFGDGIKEDAIALDLFAASGLNFFISSSFSKSFSLYGERVGALTVVTDGKDETARVVSQVKRVIRTNYSNPPTHGATVVATVLNTPALRSMWENELAEMRERIRAMRAGLVEKLQAAGVTQDFSFVLRQRGMFSYSGLTASQVDRLREEFGIYAVSSGRICVAALNQQNLDYVVQAIASVVRA
ncbi:amino acid aminotransferase [Parvibium lacunae]|uniref:Aminotransferase n=1 Tax=Parvibium lacunae TaxID=1888893 RepID=A0A368L7H4_9BURK|nr:amino acid aminotransferase [Parvibium lacunae]RCS59603.1 aspartate/tyrosine/aromatic aminotransferase [Parvibium lacunae]